MVPCNILVFIISDFSVFIRGWLPPPPKSQTNKMKTKKSNLEYKFTSYTFTFIFDNLVAFLFNLNYFSNNAF